MSNIPLFPDALFVGQIGAHDSRPEQEDGRIGDSQDDALSKMTLAAW